MKTTKPTHADLAGAVNRTIEDVIAPGLCVLFVGINPGLYSGWSGYHFARPGNRFWPTLFAAGFTPRLLAPSEQRELLHYGCGVTNFVARATARADELSTAELAAGGQRLERFVVEYQPQSVAVLGITAYRAAYARPQAVLGRQAELLGGRPVWVLPNPSGLNAHYTPATLADVFRAFRLEFEQTQRDGVFALIQSTLTITEAIEDNAEQTKHILQMIDTKGFTPNDSANKINS